MEIADGVYTLPVTVGEGDEARTFTPSAIERGDGSLLLLDVGLPGHLDDLRDALGSEGFALADVSLVVLTHHDGDHAGALATLLNRVDATTFAHPDEAPYVDGRAFPEKADPDDGRYPAARVDVEVVDGVRFSTAAGPLELVETPGHTAGHCSFYLPDEDLLFAADALLAGDGEVRGPSERFTLDMPRAMESVEKLAGLDVAGVVCFHGGYVERGTDDIAALVD